MPEDPIEWMIVVSTGGLLFGGGSWLGYRLVLFLLG